MIIGRKLFLTRGIGRHKEKLGSFEMALRDAGIAPYNLVEVSSIIPPGCEIVPMEEGLKYLKPGEITFCVLARQQSNEPHRLIAASVGLAIPADKNMYGYLSEHHSFGQTEEIAGDYAEDLAVDMLASTMGLEIDLDKAWDEQKQIWKVSGYIVKTQNITAAAVVEPDGMWTTVVAAAVFTDYECR